MVGESGRSVPTHPKLRLLEPQLVDYQGQRMIYMHDSLGIARDGALIPQPLAPLLSLCDGTRDISELSSGLLMRTGSTLPEHVIRQIIEQLDDALLLENGAYQERRRRGGAAIQGGEASSAVACGAGLSRRLGGTQPRDCGLLPRDSGGR